MKQRRRTLKNRGYAARWTICLFIMPMIQVIKKCFPFFSCRIKRIEQKDELEQEKVGELSETEKLAEDNGKIREEIEVISFIKLFKHSFYNHIIFITYEYLGPASQIRSSPEVCHSKENSAALRNGSYALMIMHYTFYHGTLIVSSCPRFSIPHRPYHFKNTY